jgi:ribosomal protein S19
MGCRFKSDRTNMSRAIWKGPIFNKRSSTIIPDLIGRTLPIHDGKIKKSVIVSSLAVGLKFGELVLTKKVPVFKKKK